MRAILFATLMAAAACSRGERIALGGGTGVGFDDLRFSPRLGRVLAPAARTGTIALVDPATSAVTTIQGFAASARYDGGHDFGVTSVDDTGTLLLVTDRTTAKLHLVDPSAGIVASADVSGTPDYVRWVAPTHEAWITEPSNEKVEVFAIPAPPGAPMHVADIAVPGGPESLVIDGTRGRAYTHLWNGRTVAIDSAVPHDRRHLGQRLRQLARDRGRRSARLPVPELPRGAGRSPSIWRMTAASCRRSGRSMAPTSSTTTRCSITSTCRARSARTWRSSA